MFLICKDLTWFLVTGPVFSLRELSTDLKNTDYHFQNLGKTTGFCSKILCKHCICDNTIYIWEYFFIFFLFLSFIVSEINFIFCSETRILKEYVVQKPDCFRLIVSKQHLIEAAVRRCSSKQVVLKIPQYSQENTNVGVSFS